MDILPLLQEVGFDSAESKVWLALVGLGRASAEVLAKRASIPRTSCYAIIERLKTKGMLVVEKKGRLSIYVAKGLEPLIELAQSEVRQSEKRVELVKQAAQQLEPFFKRSQLTIPRLQVYEGKRAVRRLLFENQLLWRESMMKRNATWLGMQDHTFLENYGDWVEQYWKMASAEPDFKKERLRLFSNGTEVESKVHRNLGAKVLGKRELRALPDGRSFTSSLWIVGDFVITVHTRTNPHFAVQMLDESLASNLLTIFESLWGLKFRG